MSKELLFWFGFLLINASHYVVNYLFYFRKTKALPYISDFRLRRQFGLTSSSNQDFFRYVVELSILVLLSRIVYLGAFAKWFGLLYVLFLVFNIYQYSLRKIFEREPNFFSDSKLLKNAIAIIWYESKLKVLLGGLSLLVMIFFLNLTFIRFFEFSYSIGQSKSYLTIAILWSLTVLWSIVKHKFYTIFPGDIDLRYHFVVMEILKNISRSIKSYHISQRKVGKAFRDKRSALVLKLKKDPPNLYFIFVESYGSYFFNEPSLKHNSWDIFNTFQKKLSEDNWSCVSNFSKSPTTGGQSWLSYSSMLYGLFIEDNTYFENYLNDPEFYQSNSLLKTLKNSGYTNYNLNPIKPISGVDVPYEQMRKFYCIDRWVLNETMGYRGDVFGWGDCPPDQYSMNFMMELIEKEKATPYTYFYLTKNSHSPFITPSLVDNWRDLDLTNGSSHIHKGFLKQPAKEDYAKAIAYELENLNRFIGDHGKEKDIFLIMGDHQPPMLSDPGVYGHDTPVHLISKNKEFLETFAEYGFQTNLKDCVDFVKHEAMFSIFLRSFMQEYCKDYKYLPEYEPDGLQL